MTSASTYVWVDAWEQQCCGEPFQVGGEVAWPVNERPGSERVAARLGAEWAGRIRFAQEHHGDDPDGLLTGTVSGIQAVACRRERSGTSLALVAGSGQRRAVQADQAWAPESNDEPGQGLGPVQSSAQSSVQRWLHEGWIVELRGARFEAARAGAKES